MKLSLKLEDDHHHQQQQLNPVVTAKIPISILNQPFLTSISTASLASSLSFSLSSNFNSGPSLKLSYSPITTTTSLSLKSGLGLFGSPNNSPLIFKAHFSFSSPNPTFSLHFKPQLGHFSLKKAIFSNPTRVSPSGSVPKPGNAEDSGSGSGSRGGEWQEVKLEPLGGDFGPKRAENGRVLEGFAVMARTVFSVGKRASVSVRWGVNLPAELGAKMPSLRMNKIAVERVEEEGERKESDNGGDLELLKGLCYWMRRDLEALESENREMKRSLEEISKLGGSKGRDLVALKPNSGARVVSGAEGLSEFERWKSKKNGKEENVNKQSGGVSDLESELQRAIAAAGGGSSSG